MPLYLPRGNGRTGEEPFDVNEYGSARSYLIGLLSSYHDRNLVKEHDVSVQKIIIEDGCSTLKQFKEKHNIKD